MTSIKTKKPIFCYNCGVANPRHYLRCKSCHKWLRPLDRHAYQFGKGVVKDNIKDQITDGIFDRFTLFIQQHAFGLLFSCTLIAGVLPNLVAALNRADDDIPTVTAAPVFVAERPEQPEETPQELPPADEPTPETPAEPTAPVSEPPASPTPETPAPTPASTSYSNFTNLLSDYFTSQSAVPRASDFNALNNTTFAAAERNSLLSAGVVPLSAGSFTQPDHSWVTIRPINIEGRPSTAFNALDLSRYQVGDYTKISRSEYLLEIYACRTAPCTPPAHAWSLSNVREVSYYYLMFISLTNPNTSDTVYYHLITSTNLPASYTASQYFFAYVYAPDDDPSVVYNFSQWFAFDWYPYDYTR